VNVVMRASGSQAYGVFVRFFPCRVYIDSSRRNTVYVYSSL
jgi:hypothetical protein